MDITRLKQLAQAEGHIEDFIERTVADAAPDVADQAARLNAAWLIIATGLKDLRLENSDLENKLALAKNALG
jgi:hypothetical protein